MIAFAPGLLGAPAWAVDADASLSARYLARPLAKDVAGLWVQATPSAGVELGACLRLAEVAGVPWCARGSVSTEAWWRTVELPADEDGVLRSDGYVAWRLEPRVSLRLGGRAQEGTTPSIEAGLGVSTAVIDGATSHRPTVSARPAVRVKDRNLPVALHVAVDLRYAGVGDAGGTGIALLVGAGWSRP